jgi:integrase|tara:strand:- start:1318 stop:2523 length:1206 start_codon:yes stop_codon:yes gene_type:complete
MLDELPIPSNRKEYFDDTVKGLTLRITKTGIKTFSVMKRVNGKMVRTTIGRYPTLTIKQARVKAINILSIINDGINPKQQATEHELKNITLNQVLDDYITSRGTNLKANTTKNYLGTFNGYLKDWGNKELLSINRDMVEKRHRKITKQSPTRANTTMRLLRALFNYAIGEYEDAKHNPIILHNPVSRLSHVKAWNREKRKQTIIKTHELKTWWNAIHELPTHKLNTKYINGTTHKQPNHSKTARDFFIFVLMTGLRRREASNLTWADIDFKNKGLTIENTKNHETHTLPLTDYLIALLNHRKANTDSIFVFEGNDPTKPINTLQKQVVKARTISGIYFSIHDLRRTFITIAESLSIREYTLKRLMNHKNGRDVTAGYIIKEIESLREPMEKISNFILEQVK